MKSKLFKLMLAGFVAVSFFSSCGSDDDDTSEQPVVNSTYAVSGNVTYADAAGTSTKAAGAVVFLYENASAEAATASQTTVADANGTYSFKSVADGTHFIVAKYNTENTNTKGDGIDGVTYMSEGNAVTVAGAAATQNIVVGTYMTTGSDLISLEAGFSRESHSKVTWNTIYNGDKTLLTGGFGMFGFYEFAFDQANPTATKISAWVQLSSISTFDAGRDKLNKCVFQDLGIDTVVGGTLDANTDTAYFEANSVEPFGNGYLAKGTLTFRKDTEGKAITSDVDMFFIYKGMLDVEKSGVITNYATFEGEFTFKVATVHGMDYSGGDDVNVNIHLMMTKKN